MRIVKLTPAVEKKLLRARRERDAEAERMASQIVADVRKRGDAALFAWAKKLDGIDLRRESLWISESEIRTARRQVTVDFIRAVEHAARNVQRLAERQLPKPWTIDVESGVKISQVVRPIESIGCYIPGGQFSLVSTLIMTVVPAIVAGVPKIEVVCPRPNTALLSAAAILGIKRIARIGGVQAIAALAYGTESILRVEKVFGPGNKYVTAAKQLVSSDCAIDLPAGPTEAIVLCEHGNARWIAADLLAQAEHAIDAASLFVTTSRSLAREVQREIQWQLAELPSGIAKFSTALAGAILVAGSLAQACDFVNRYAPEHLSLPENAKGLLQKIRSAGTVFLGPWAAQPLGDYASGSNHVLPTGGWTRKRGGLSAADFVKCISVQSITRKGFLRLGHTVETLAESEGLMAHRNAVWVRR
ncbi:MAG: histidinol dehydrogenase [Candidatus Acidiferrum sp.]